MSVEQHDFEGCCTACILTDFGQSRTSEYGYSDIGHKRLRREVITQVLDAKEEGNGIVTAIITSQQTRAADVLKELGFVGTGAAQKTRHSEVTIELYYLHCKDWKAPEEPVGAQVERPRDANGRFLPAQQEAVNPFVRPVQWKAVSDLDNTRFVDSFNQNNGYVAYGPEPILFDSLEKRTIDNIRQAKNRRALTWVQV